MSQPPELIAAIKDRIEAGQDKTGVKEAVLEAGYDDAEFEEAYLGALRIASAPDIEDTPTTKDSMVVEDAPAQSNYIFPSALSMIKQGFVFAFTRLSLTLSVVLFAVLLIGASAAIWFAETVYSIDSVEYGIISAAVAAVILISVFLYLWRLLATLYITAQPDPSAVSVKEGVRWANRKFLALVWVWVLMLLTFFGGFFLLVIPGIALAISLYFAGAVYAAEGVGGFKALARSHELIKGKRWELFLKIILVKILLFVLAIPFYAIIVGAIALLPGEGAPLLLSGLLLGTLSLQFILFILLAQVVSAIWAIVTIYVFTSLYKAAAAARPATNPEPKRRWFVVLAILGVIFIGLIIAGGIVVSSHLAEQGLQYSDFLNIEYLQEKLDSR